MPLMRAAFQDELDGVSQTLVELSNMVAELMANSTRALASADRQLAESVIASDHAVDEKQHALDARIIEIIARQQPVASDLRALITALRMSADLERMGDLAHHIAKITRLRFPNCAVPEELGKTFIEIGRVAEAIALKTAMVIETRDTEMAIQVEKDDDAMDQLHRDLIANLLSKEWVHGVESAIDLTLLGRYYERYADHAVSVARRVYFLVTGKYFD
jgi:phosphate transport system protein